MHAPLDDLLVVSLEQAVAAPYCSRLLAEGGARVIKLERPEGDFARAYDTVVKGDCSHFVWLNGGKESVVVDLRNDDDRQLVRNLLAKADVFIQNLRPGAVERLGLGYDDVATLNPAIVMCSISGYGREGSYADMKAYDALIQAETALCSVTGPPGQPSKVGPSVVDISTGLTAYGEILKALLARGRRGHGEHIDVSLFGTMSEWMAVPLAYYDHGGRILGGTGLDHNQIAPYGAFRCSDGLVFIVVQNQREWSDLCTHGLARPELVDDPRYATNPDRIAHIAELKGDIEAVLSTMNRADAAAQLLAAGIACGSINDVSDLSTHPALKRKDVVTSGNPVSLVRRVGDTLESPRVPALGEHDSAVRREFL